MDKLKSGQEERDSIQKIPSGDKETRRDGEVVGGTAEVVDNDKTVNSWVHDKEMNFSGARNALQVVADTIRKSIDLEKERLSKLTKARDTYKK